MWKAAGPKKRISFARTHTVHPCTFFVCVYVDVAGAVWIANGYERAKSFILSWPFWLRIVFTNIIFNNKEKNVSFCFANYNTRGSAVGQNCMNCWWPTLTCALKATLNDIPSKRSRENFLRFEVLEVYPTHIQHLQGKFATQNTKL